MRVVLATSVFCTIAALSPAATSHAGEQQRAFFATYFTGTQGGTPCYGRTYDDAHLKAHPEQKVHRIEIDMDKADANERVNTAERFELGIAVMRRASAEWYGQVAICKATDAAAECYLEGDGGLFKLTPANDGGLRLETGSYGMSFEGEKDVLELSGTDGDDRVFVLKSGRDECDAANAYFGADAKSAN